MCEDTITLWLIGPEADSSGRSVVQSFRLMDELMKDPSRHQAGLELLITGTGLERVID
jgi:hypothetical protein